MGFKLTNKDILHNLHGNVKPSALKFGDPDTETELTEDVITSTPWKQDNDLTQSRTVTKLGSTEGGTNNPIEESFKTLTPELKKKHNITDLKSYEDYVKNYNAEKNAEVTTEFRDRKLVKDKKLDDYWRINQKNMMGLWGNEDQKYDWDNLYKNWHHTAKLQEPRGKDDYFLDERNNVKGGIDFDFGVDKTNTEGKTVKSYTRDGYALPQWEKIPAGRLPYSDINDPDIQGKWAANMMRSYNQHLRDTAKEYQKNLNLGNMWKIGLGNYVGVDDEKNREDRKLLTQEQHQEIYDTAHNSWFANFKKAYPEINWKHRDEVKGEGSSSQHYTDYKNRG